MTAEPESGNIYLIGYRCTGKSTVGKRLADRWGRPFVDADLEVVRVHGMTIQHMVAARGWAAFRDTEHRILQRIAGRSRQVVATGGGVVLLPENVAIMRQTGRIVWLRADADTIRRRLRADRQTERLRPSLTASGTDAEIESVLEERTPLYAAASDLTVDTDARPIDAVCRAITDGLPGLP